MLPLPSEQALEELLVRKEEEWRALQAQRSQLQEAAVQEVQSRLEEAQGKLQRLQEDFVYNLQVLEERDRELERYDAAFAQARGLEEARQAEVSELKIEVAKLRQALATEARRLEDAQQQYQLRLQEHRLELERVHSDKNSEIDHQREQYENLKWKLERRLEELDGELALQRQELLLEFECETQKREHEFRLRADGMSNLVLMHELKVKLLNKELVALKEAGAKAAESLQSAEMASSELERRLQCRDQELRELAAVRDARIEDLEGKLCSVQLTRKKEEEMFRRKHEELDRLARERDEVLAAVKDAHVEQLRVLESRALELQAHCETLELQLHRAEQRQADALKEKDAVIDRLREDTAALKSGWDAQIAQLSKEMIAKDLQAQSLQGEEGTLQAQLARCQQDIGRYKQQLCLAAEREQSLEREKVQLELDWQRRCEGLERDQFQRSEDLIRALTMAKEQVAAKLQETERTLCDQEVVLKALTLERDQAVQALRTRGPLPGKEVQMLPSHHEGEISKSFPSSEIQRLQEQNTSLRNTIAQMRKEMETLSDQILPSAQSGRETSNTSLPDSKTAADAPTPDYVLALEAEIRTLKHKFKTLEEQLEVLDPSKKSTSYPDVQPSVHSSTETAGGTMLADGASLGLLLQRLGDRAHLLNFLVTRIRQKVLQKALDVDTVQRELPHEVDQVHLEVLELRKQVAELEERLGTAWKEGRVVSSRQQLRAPDSTALRREDPADGASLGTVEQGTFSVHLGPEAQPTQALSVPRLQRKLKEAARKILHLRLEKEQLLEMGNRLRAELGRPTGKLSGRSPPTPGAQKPGEAPEAPLGHLQPHFPTQDSQDAKKERFSECSGKIQPCSAQIVRRNETPCGSEAGVAVGPGQKQHKSSTMPCKSTRQKEGRSSKSLPAQEFREENGHHTQRSSSLASSSLQDAWKFLDLGSSPSGLTSQEDCTQAADSLQHSDRSPIETWAAFAVKGMKMEAQEKARPTRPARAHPAKPKGCQWPPKIRNYNFKD
ncbi:coiled-coil domain-containing protein 57 isoform X1 [Equus quagga]|uniref:coiled-coil domain-containing protein 57 isoform X1 n=1 Tax=Equus quagga TaxID=89248 RepID=UPI001EE31D42|nr:coiled-coil domain-containing protein 57 isoform X1 [Equus quagga]XP_046530962.1 coiled-coil domain-containing protein 57 isoform X1 [Equus quagga]XP_046530963.1 coiled-coil domain-containing protein 57 isoform X1 [Equus quagga]XP_046530964.1 coiled-coil domain-containing protein 57 isoform X1 [Equus quagga]